MFVSLSAECLDENVFGGARVSVDAVVDSLQFEGDRDEVAPPVTADPAALLR
jgi:hypothetical protein